MDPHSPEEAAQTEQKMRRLVAGDGPDPQAYSRHLRIDWVHDPDRDLLAGLPPDSGAGESR